ncbi:Uncharacterised protein [Mycobacteroides abscessus subsp. abscessus]|nr:Uncharacterised protein [Mycobacteroides abscessus subsp. abscessus]
MSLGALAPGMSTAPITRSARLTAPSSSMVDEYRVRMVPPNSPSSSRSLPKLTSKTVT